MQKCEQGSNREAAPRLSAIAANGKPSKPTGHLQEAIIAAAEMIGRSVGKEGLTGYCSHLAQEQPKAFAALLGRVLPMQVTGADGDPFELILQ